MGTRGRYATRRLGAGAWVVLALTGLAAAQVTTRASVDSAELQGNDHSEVPSVSADGRYVAFHSEATNLVPGDTNAVDDAFLRDRLLGTTERVSVGAGGVQGNGASTLARISDDGRFVAFESSATNLVAGDTNAAPDVFVRDRLLGTTERVSLGVGGAEATAACQLPAISGDGRYVAFASPATNLVAGDTNGLYDVFVRDRQTSTTECVSLDPGGAPANSQSTQPTLSSDGRYVAFHSSASNLVIFDFNNDLDVFVRDRVAGTTERVSVDSFGLEANNGSEDGSISRDGLHVVFQSTATNLVAGDTNSMSDVFVHDRGTGTTERVNVGPGGVQGNHLSGMSMAVASGGRYVAFFSAATNLVAGGTISGGNIFIRDRLAGTTELASADSAGIEGSSGSGITVNISSDGRFVVFQSPSTNLVAGDTNASVDVFVRAPDDAGMIGFCYPGIAGIRTCPCGNPATAPDRGCDNFVNPTTLSGTGGAKLTASGVPHASVASTLVFHVVGAHNTASNTNSHTFWKGTTTLATGVKTGFGVRCIAGVMKRIYIGIGTGTGGLGSTNAIDFPNGTQTTNAWTASQMPAPGTTLYYYDSFRDQQGPTTCNALTDRFNLSNAGAVTWIP